MSDSARPALQRARDAEDTAKLKEELKLVKTGVARDEELETLQNEIRALKEQLSAQTRPRLTPAQIVHVSG